MLRPLQIIPLTGSNPCTADHASSPNTPTSRSPGTCIQPWLCSTLPNSAHSSPRWHSTMLALRATRQCTTPHMPCMRCTKARTPPAALLAAAPQASITSVLTRLTHTPNIKASLQSTRGAAVPQSTHGVAILQSTRGAARLQNTWCSSAPATEATSTRLPSHALLFFHLAAKWAHIAQRSVSYLKQLPLGCQVRVPCIHLAARQSAPCFQLPAPPYPPPAPLGRLVP